MVVVACVLLHFLPGLHLKPVLLNMLLASGIGAAADSMVQVFYEDRCEWGPLLCCFVVLAPS